MEKLKVKIEEKAEGEGKMSHLPLKYKGEAEGRSQLGFSTLTFSGCLQASNSAFPFNFPCIV